ncbi:MAG: response regulator [Ignavibacterium sp.]|jgi:CheY-like chemotaxis protein
MYQTSSQANILLVDDNDEFRRFFSSVMTDEFSHRVVVASSGHEALEILRGGRAFFDVIFLDYFMPGMSGLEVLHRLKEEGIRIPVVVLTGAGNETVAVEAMKLGAYDYLRKEDIDIPHLGTVIEATRERHMFRVAKELEEDQAREILLNKEATERVRSVLNAMTPALNSALAEIAVHLEIHAPHALREVEAGTARSRLSAIFRELQRQVAVLESGIKGLLNLYQLVYARHEMSSAIEEIERELEEKIKALKSGEDPPSRA